MEEYGCKVCRVLADRNLTGYDDKLVRQWTGKDGERKGYRALAQWLNVSFLHEEMARAGLSTRGDEPESKYHRLSGTDEVVAHEVHQLLLDEGLPMESIERDFVSYGVVRKHLKDCLGAKREKASQSPWHREAIEYTTDMAQRKVEDAVRAAYNRGALSAGKKPTVSVSIAVSCPDCGEQRDVLSAIEGGAVCLCVTEARHTSSVDE